MKEIDQLARLSGLLSPTDIMLVVLAARQDALVWNALAVEKLAEKSFSRLDQTLDDWSPASLALLALDLPFRPADLRSEPLAVLDAAMQERATQAWDGLFAAGSHAASLAEAGLVALALRERFRLSGSWEGLVDLASLPLALNNPKALQIWRAALACAYGLVPDPAQFLKALLPGKFSLYGLDWIGHCVLCTPAPLTSQVELLAGVYMSVDLQQQIDAVAHINLRGRTELAQKLAQVLVNSGQPSILPDTNKIDTLSLAEIPARAARMQQMAALYQQAGYIPQALSMLKSAQELLEHSLASVQLHQAGLSSQSEALPEWLRPAASASTRLQVDWVLGAGSRDNGQMSDALLPRDSRQPLVMLHLARAAAQSGDRSRAQTIARQAVPLLLSQLSEPSSLWLRSSFPVNFTAVLSQLDDLDLIEEAASCARTFLAARPADLPLLVQSIHAFERAGALPQALEQSRLAVLLAPEDPAAHRRLARIYEVSGQWEKSLQEREQLLTMISDPASSDLLDLARSAFHTGRADRAAEICALVLEKEPDQGGAHSLLGEILLEKGQKEDASRHLTRATLLAPDDPRPWLLLADMQSKSGGIQRALETLRAAVLAVPTSSELFFALAKACLDAGLPSEALPFLQEAAHLNPDSPEIAWKLGKTLFSLGHIGQSRGVLENARRKWPHHPQVAVADAETLIETGLLEAAVPALEVALQNDEIEPEWYLLYARALLNDDPERALLDSSSVDPARLAKAQLALQKLLGIQPWVFEASVLQAEALYLQGELEQAIEAYRELAERPESAQPEWRWRIQAGFGQAAMALSQYDSAVAALREAAAARPENLTMHQLLASAYQKANLAQEAAQSARQALALSPDTLPNLAWFIDFMREIGREQETLDALNTATQLAPDRPAFWNRLARLKQQRGDAAGSRQALASALNIPGLPPDELLATSRTYLRLGDGLAALSCLEQAVALDARAAWFMVIAWLRSQTGDVEPALEALSKAEELAPDEIALHVFQADLLSQLKKSQAAVACLERALRLLESQSLAHSMDLPAGWLPDGWIEALRAPRAIYTRLALLLKENGMLPAALLYAEKAVEAEPGDLSLRYLAAELARSMLLPAKALEFAKLRGDQEAPEGTDPRWKPALCSLTAELKLESGADSEAAVAVEEDLKNLPDETRFLAVQARLLARMGDLPGARASYAAALKRLPSAVRPAQNPTSDFSYERLFSAWSDLYLAEAALELQFWPDAVRLFEQVAAKNPNDPRAHVRFARALVLQAETQRLCDSLKSTAHAPGEFALSLETVAKFDRAIQAASKLSGAVEVAVWQARGKAVFHPNVQYAPVLAKLPQPVDHAPALLAVLRHSKNCENAVKIAHHYPESPSMLVELALCYADLDIAKGLDCAQKAVSKDNTQPLHLACLALLSEKAGDLGEALRSIETALQSWPEESGWHAWAARLARELNDSSTAILHWEKLLALDPGSIEAACELGQLYLDSGEPAKAASVLEKAVGLDEKDSSLWMLLAQAHRLAGNFAEALRCSDQAAQLDPSSPAPRLLNGEVALQMGKPDAALKQARAALSCTPDSADAVLFLSRVLVQKGNLAEGLSTLEKTLPAMKGSLPIMLERANLIRRLYGSQTALPAYLELAQAFPKEAVVLSQLAQTQADCGDLKSAERSAYAAYNLNPQLPQLNFLLGRLQHSAGQLDQAIHFLSEAIRQSPADLDPYLELGQAYLERREHLQALRTYQQAIKIAPRDYRPFYQAAGVLRDSKDYTGAEAMLRRAAELAPDDLNIRRQLGAVIALNLVHNSQEANSVL